MRALEITATRGKWIDQSQSHNVFMKGRSGKLLSDIYMAAWRFGLKTTYYLRTMAATQIEKSTLDAARFGYTQKREYMPLAAAPAVEARPLGGNGSGASGARYAEEPRAGSLVQERPEPSLCRIDDPDCEACQ